MRMNTVAVDVGYGNTKYAFSRGAELVTQMFPSLAPTATRSKVTGYGGGFFKTRDVITVQVDGAFYEVGPEVSLSSAYGDTGRTLSEDFATTAEYAALLGGALHYSGATEIDQLVLGLPVHTTQKYAQHLRDRFTGTLNFGNGDISIRSVAGLPQPLGSLVTFMRQHGQDYDGRNAHLVIDVGYFTTDWVVARGYTMDDTRSGGVPGGSSRICQQISELIAEQEGEPVSDIERIDQALRDATTLWFYEKHINLQPLLEQVRPVCHSAVKEIQSRVGRSEDIRSIILSGGGSALYAPAIRAAFPRTPMKVLDSPCFANVRGFYDIGSSRQQRAAA